MRTKMEHYTMRERKDSGWLAIPAKNPYLTPKKS